MRLKRKSSWKKMQMERAYSVESCKCLSLFKLSLRKASRLKGSYLLQKHLKESQHQRPFEIFFKEYINQRIKMVKYHEER